MAFVANDEAKLHFLHLESRKDDKTCHEVVRGWNSKQMYLIQAAQEHFIADDKNVVERRRHKVLYPVVLRAVTKKIGHE